jgi:UV DNA damage endonuclease
MRVGYPCINLTLKCTTNKTFRLASYSEKKLVETVQHNIDDLKAMLEFNVKHKLLLFRIGSGFIPFASHPICTFDWKAHFAKEFKILGTYIKKHNIRICMHPDQFILLNAKQKNIVSKSIAELKYQCELLDALQLDTTAKVQIHVGGVYGDKPESTKRFIDVYKKISPSIKRRLVIENDDFRFSLADCLDIYQKTNIPVVFDSFHHECLNNGETFLQAITAANKTWKKSDGLLMIDYSSQHPDKRKGSHIEHINMAHFKKFIIATKSVDFDLMCEIKDKEKSAIKVAKMLFTQNG